MTAKLYQPALLGRTWDFLLDTSEAAVAIYYDAPWSRAQCVPVRI